MVNIVAGVDTSGLVYPIGTNYNAGTGIARLYVDAEFSGQPVTISGQHIFVESGVHIAGNISVSGNVLTINSGANVCISGQHVFVESGVHIVGALTANVSGQPVTISGQPVTISGDHVFIESGVNVIVESGVHLAGSVSVSGNVIDINSGANVCISGQHVFVESGVYLASGLYVVTQAGGGQVSGGIIISGSVIVSGNVGISGTVDAIVQSGAYLASGLYVVTAAASGTYQASGVGVQIQSGVHLAGTVSVSGNVIDINSGANVCISGQHVFVESGVHLASGVGVVIQSGAGVLISGQHVYVESGVNVIVESGVHLAGIVSVSGNILDINSGVNVCTPVPTVVQNAVVSVTYSTTQFPAHSIESVVVKNLGVTAVASSGVSGANIWIGDNVVLSGKGMFLQSGEKLTINIENMNDIYACGETSGLQVALIGT